MYDNIPPGIAIPLAIILWIALIIHVFKDVFIGYVNDFFAWRRHVRREKTRKQKELEAEYAYMRAYAEKDIEAMMTIYNVHTGDHAK